MRLLLIYLGIITILELLLWTPLMWRWRKAIACLLILSLSVVSGLLFGGHLEVWAGLILIFSVYRMVNLLRVVESRLQLKYLYRAARRTSWLLILFQLVVLGIAWLNHQWPQPDLGWLYALGMVQFFAALILFSSTNRHLRSTKPPRLQASYADRDLPSLSVAIPARNETDDLEACLQSLIASNYTKLEILVLDDCSQNKRTPEIIRGYAHDGVRFIAGKTPPKDWLAKNYAYKQLADEANGELLLFCGVDTRFQPGSLRSMAEILLSKQKNMLSIIPRNKLPTTWSLEALMVQPGRYAWELALPRRLFQRPPVLSTCWLITRSLLKTAGGFEAVSRSISAESYFAKQAANHDDGYTFTQSDETIDLTSAKSLSEQRATAIRTRYPQLHRRPELVALFSVMEFAVLSLPFGLLIGSLADRAWLLLLVSAINCLLLVSFYSKIVNLTYRRFLWRGIWLLPLVGLYDVGLLNHSMWQYEFREVIWKNRNVCIPLMRVVPKLPDSN